MRDPVALAEKILQLLDQGTFVATYKYAVLLGLLDACMEHTSSTGEPPSVLTTRQLAEKVLALYWPHVLPFEGTVLRQNKSRPGTQAEIVRRIQRYRQKVQAPTLHQAGLADPKGLESLLWFVEWKLIEMPLPRLQLAGGRENRVLYDVGWGTGVQQAPVTAHQQGKPNAFDPSIRLLEGVGAQLVRLNGLLRPLIHRQWAAEVARINGLPESRLEAFLFGVERVPTTAIRDGLRELQDNRCFYCAERLRSQDRMKPEVDHFIPWARYPDNAIENLVVAHQKCNGWKRDFLASVPHVTRWAARLQGGRHEQLLQVSDAAGWESRRNGTVGVAAAIYLGLPDDTQLWTRGTDEFEPVDRESLQGAFSGLSAG